MFDILCFFYMFHFTIRELFCLDKKNLTFYKKKKKKKSQKKTLNYEEKNDKMN